MTEAVKEAYLRETRTLLSGHPTELQIFEGLWAAEKYREAFLAVDSAVRNLGLARTEQGERADEDFYWTFR